MIGGGAARRRCAAEAPDAGSVTMNAKTDLHCTRSLARLLALGASMLLCVACSRGASAQLAHGDDAQPAASAVAPPAGTSAPADGADVVGRGLPDFATVVGRS